MEEQKKSTEKGAEWGAINVLSRLMYFHNRWRPKSKSKLNWLIEQPYHLLLLTFGCEERDAELSRGLETALVWGVLILGDTYDLGEEASDANDMGDWPDCWAVYKKQEL